MSKRLIDSDNPFEGLEEAFAADLEARRVEFPMHGHPCYVVLQAMDSSAEARYRGLQQEVRVSASEARTALETGENLEAKVVPQVDESELLLLLGTVKDFRLARKKTAKGGKQQTVEVTDGREMSDSQRKTVYRSLTPAFRSRLVQLCVEVNHLDPLPPSETVPSTEKASESSSPESDAPTSES